MPEHLRDVWLGWRLVVEGVATLDELETSWSIDDALDATDALEAMRRAEHQANQIK